MQNKSDLERVQKTALKIILDSKYKSYKQALNYLELDSLNDRREALCLSFARKSAKHPKFQHLFPKNNKLHNMKTRRPEKYKVTKALTERFKTSSIIYMQRLLNEHDTYSAPVLNYMACIDVEGRWHQAVM